MGRIEELNFEYPVYRAERLVKSSVARVMSPGGVICARSCELGAPKSAKLIPLGITLPSE